MQDMTVVSRDEWTKARLALLEEEKRFTRTRDALSEMRRKLPAVKVEKDYRFETENGTVTLVDLFADKSQLIIQHFMYGTDWEEGCPSCSFWADGYNGFAIHIGQRDAALMTVSKAPLEKLLAYKRRMGWTFPWVSSENSSFNEDFQVSFTPDMIDSGDAVYNYRTKSFPSTEAPGISVFVRNDAGKIFHTYSTYSRGLDMMNAAYHYLDLLPKGRDEDALDYPMAWVKRHDKYE
ncbi:MAG: thioredoxin family protein [Pseudomonadota bacterium]